ncbi:MAG: hypothetical protein NTX50_02575, partial [Candidatus Sumerlaeota bacterium]|nr:hypothetical protein [Candidatus Sumerlaeota bacterium]
LIVAAYVIQRSIDIGPDKEAAFGFACRELLFPGLTGLMVACVLAANMSTCSNFMVNTGALFTKNVFLRYYNPEATDKQILWTGKLSGLGLTVFGILFALMVEQVLDAFLFTETLSAMMGIMFLGGILWKRANRHGALAALFSSLITYYAFNYLMTCHATLGEKKLYDALLPAFRDLAAAFQNGHGWEFLSSGDVKIVYRWMPGAYGLATLIGFLFLVVVSLLTRAESREQVERFFDNMRRSTDSEGLPDGSTKPLATDLGQDLILLDLGGWLRAERWRGFFKRYREDLIGFFLAWGSVGLLVLAAWAIMQIGK